MSSRLPVVVVVLSAACSAPSAPAPVARDPLLAARVLDPGCAGSAYGGIQAAIDDAVAGDVIEICPGTYAERLNIVGKQLTLRSRDGADVTIIDAQDLGKTLSIRTGSDVLVEGLTFINGNGGTGRGGNVHCADSALVLRDSVLQGGVADKGGGLSTRTCSGLAEGNRFEGNHALGKGGGAYMEQIGATFDAIGNEVISNTADGQGAGLYFYDGVPLCDGNLFVGNRTRTEGGGLRVKNSGAIITNNTFVANRAGQRGGAVKVSHHIVTMSGNTYRDNWSGVAGGATFLFESASTLTNELYEGNDSQVGGALYIAEGWGGLTIEDSTFDGNTAFAGGHVYVRLLGYPTTLRRVDMVGGLADIGGAVYADESDLRLENTLLQGNVAATAGGALFLDTVTGRVTNAVAIWNDAPDGAVVSVVNGVAGLTFRNTAVAENWTGAAIGLTSGVAPTFAYDDFSANASDFSGMASVVGLDGNEALPTAFVDAQAGDFSLDATSALIDLGDPTILDLDGTRSDVGLFGGPSAY